MTKRTRNWLVGAGAGCGALILLVVGVVGAGVLAFKDALEEFEAADETLEAVAELHGPIQEFRAPPGGEIHSGRIEAFLLSREKTAPQRERVEVSLNVLSSDEELGAWRRFTSGATLLHSVAGFLTERNKALMEAEMGLGEYYYIYTVAYYGWLGKSPADGPSFKLVNDEGYVLDTVFEGRPETEVREDRMRITRESLNSLLLPVLRNQLAEPDPGEGAAGDAAGWREALSVEIAALEARPDRIPWEDGLPEVIESSLRPYRERLEANYSPMCNELEIGLARR